MTHTRCRPGPAPPRPVDARGAPVGLDERPSRPATPATPTSSRGNRRDWSRPEERWRVPVERSSRPCNGWACRREKTRRRPDYWAGAGGRVVAFCRSHVENDLRWWMRTSFAFGTARLLPIGSPSPSCETNAPSRCPGNWGFMFTPRLKRSSALLRSRSRNITAPGS